jgi:hypothetical protein
MGGVWSESYGSSTGPDIQVRAGRDRALDLRVGLDQPQRRPGRGQRGLRLCERPCATARLPAPESRRPVSLGLRRRNPLLPHRPTGVHPRRCRRLNVSCTRTRRSFRHTQGSGTRDAWCCPRDRAAPRKARSAMRRPGRPRGTAWRTSRQGSSRDSGSRDATPRAAPRPDRAGKAPPHHRPDPPDPVAERRTGARSNPGSGGPRGGSSGWRFGGRRAWRSPPRSDLPVRPRMGWPTGI